VYHLQLLISFRSRKSFQVHLQYLGICLISILQIIAID